MLNDAAVSHFKKVYLAPGYTDLRRGIDGLASIVRFQFELDPYDKNTLFLFCGRKKAAGSRHQINCLILLMSVYSRFVCAVFQICSFIVFNKKLECLYHSVLFIIILYFSFIKFFLRKFLNRKC